MNSIYRRFDRRALLLVAACGLLAAGPGASARAGEAKLFESRHARLDFPLTADPDAPEWKGVPGVLAERDPKGQVVPGYRTEIRSRWTQQNLYLLFVCPYEELYLKPDPSLGVDTDKLWEWDVAEAFIGADFQHIERYREFQVSPQGEWVDLAIDRGAKPPSHDTTWNSGYEVKAKVDRDRRIWYGEMRIPIASIDSRPPRAGLEMRINLYRCQGPPPNRKLINWQPVNGGTFHTPTAFGRLRLK